MRLAGTILVAFLALAACSGGGPAGPALAPLPSPLLRGPVVAEAHLPSDPMAVFDPVTEGPFGRLTMEIDSNVLVATAFGSVAATTSTGAAHTSRLEGLRAGVTYHYRLVFDGTVVGGVHAFRTAPADR